MFNSFKTFAFFGIFFFFGFNFFYHISDKASQQRELATVDGKIFQIANLSTEQIKDQLQKKIKVTPTIDGKKTISFSGFSSALCKSYQSIEVEFAAEGIAVGGIAPSMKILSPCNEAQDPSEIKAITLPIARILKEKPRNAEFKFDGYNSVITFYNSADEWPQQWVLKRVEFKNQSGINKSAEFGRSPASADSNIEKPIVLEF